MDEFLYNKIFNKRSIICFLIVIVLFFTCILRVAVIGVSGYGKVQKEQTSYRLSAGNIRGTIYDCNMIPLTNKTSKIIAAVSPTPRAITGISGVLDGIELDNALARLKSGKPILCEVPENIECDGISCTRVYIHNTSDMLSTHLIGYVDSDSHGVTGLEKAYDNILYSKNGVSFIYTIDGHGKILEGIVPEIENDMSVIAGGVISTIDSNIQTIAEKEALNIDSGAIVIADAKTLKIRALVSRPGFDCTDVKSYLKKDDSPLLNRALSAYNVGSVFKPCVAIAGIESGHENFEYYCTGRCKIVDRYFKCHKASGHGQMNLELALANSCNTFFYNFAFNIGAKKIFNTASALNFGNKLKLCKDIFTTKGNMPDIDELQNIAYLANFSIGQGELLLSPVSMLTLYGSIASSGSYYVPSIVEGTIKDGNIKKYNIGNPTYVMSSNTAKSMRYYLSKVITEGTGKAAKPSLVTAGGKTATAQTGKYENNEEICQGWFCGFFPVEEPKYVVIVFSENNMKQAKSCGQIFSDIADNISKKS